jgi:hypothetical protein
MLKHVIFDENSFPAKDHDAVSMPSQIATRDDLPFPLPVSVHLPILFLKSKLMVVPHISLQRVIKIYEANEDTINIQYHEGLASLASIDLEETTNT